MSALRYPATEALSGLHDVSMPYASAETCTTVNLEALMGMHVQWNVPRTSDAGTMPIGLSAQHARLAHAQGSTGPQAMTLPPWVQVMPNSSWLQAASSAAPLYAPSRPCNEQDFHDSQPGELGNTSPFGCVHPGVALMANSIQGNWFEALQPQLPAGDHNWADQSWATGREVPNPLHGQFDAATPPRCPDVTPSSVQPSQVDGGHDASGLQRLPRNPLNHILAAVPKSWAASTGISNASPPLGPHVAAESSSTSACESTSAGALQHRAPKLVR